MTYTIIIPARFESQRLPGKLLLEIAGKPMIQHVYEKAIKTSASKVVIATDDERIQTQASKFGAEVYLTSKNHPSGTDRIYEVVEQLELGENHVIVNVQGDEPLIPPVVIDQVAHNLLQREEAHMATLCHPIHDIAELQCPNAVKVVINSAGFALYFSRAVIPWPREQFRHNSESIPEGVNFYRHIGIYAYRASYLQKFVQWQACELENTEHLEQLRALYHGAKIHVELACEPVPTGVDTENDLVQLRKQFDTIAERRK